MTKSTCTRTKPIVVSICKIPYTYFSHFQNTKCMQKWISTFEVYIINKKQIMHTPKYIKYFKTKERIEVRVVVAVAKMKKLMPRRMVEVFSRD